MSLSGTILKTIYQLRNTGGTNDKERILHDMRLSPTFQQVLFRTYSPFIRYHIRKIPVGYRGVGTGDIDQDTWTLLNKLSLRKLTGNVARETLFEHLESRCPSAEQLIRLIIAKDLKCGVATATINKVMPNLIPTFECQEVDDWEERRVKYPILCGPKVDCIRGEFRAGQFFTKRGHKITGVEHITKYIKSIGKNIELSGELYIPGMKFHRASGIIRSNKAKKLNVKFAAFDITNLSSMPYDQRLSYLSKLVFPLGTTPYPDCVYIPHVMANNKNDVAALFKRWVAMGWEGLVGKAPAGFIKAGKGSYDWMRMVYEIKAEYKIINVYESDEMPGMLGGVTIEGNINVGSGFTEDERRKYWAQPELILGRYATIAAKEKTKSGSLRQPIWHGVRWDI